MGRKKRNIQWKFRRMHFDSHRYWQISYTEKYPDGTEKDYRTFVRSKSYKQAKKILQMRLEEDEPCVAHTSRYELVVAARSCRKSAWAS